MKLEEKSIDNLYVCYCLLKKGEQARYSGEQLQQISGILYRVQEYYEEKGAKKYNQAFVFGNREVAARGFIDYGDGFRAALDENVETYSISDALLLSYALLKDAMPEGNSQNSRLNNMYRLVIIADYPLDTEDERTRMLVEKIGGMKKGRNFKICYWDAEGQDRSGKFLDQIIDIKMCDSGFAG